MAAAATSEKRAGQRRPASTTSPAPQAIQKIGVCERVIQIVYVARLPAMRAGFKRLAGDPYPELNALP